MVGYDTIDNATVEIGSCLTLRPQTVHEYIGKDRDLLIKVMSLSLTDNSEFIDMLDLATGYLRPWDDGRCGRLTVCKSCAAPSTGGLVVWKFRLGLIPRIHLRPCFLWLICRPSREHRCSNNESC